MDDEPAKCGMSLASCRQILALWTVGYLGQCYEDSYGFRLGLGGFERVLVQVRGQRMHSTRAKGHGRMVQLALPRSFELKCKQDRIKNYSSQM